MPEAPYSPQFGGQFPSPIMPRAEMNKPETGYQVADSIYQSSIFGANSYYSIRNTKFAQNRTFAIGRQPFQTYLDLLGVDGKQAFANFQYHPRPVAPKFRNILVNDIMARMESVDCTGLSQSIQERKHTRKTEMAFKMKHGDFIQVAEKAAGTRFSDNGEDFTPETEEELELWSQLNDKEKEELLMSEGIEFIMYNNDEKSIKKEVAEDLVDTGMGCEYTYFDGRKRIRVKRIRPEYLVYGTTNTLNFRNIPYVGHLERISILDIRAMYPDYPEATLYRLAYQYRGLYGNPDQLTDFIVDYELAYTRPYDSYLIDVLFFRYKVLKTIDYTRGSDNNDNPILEYRKSDGSNPKKQPGKIQIPTWYEGAWLIGANDMLAWGEMENLIRNNEDVEDVSSGYGIYMLNNNGDMIPMSPMESIRSSIVQMDLAILRMQNTLAVTPPNGFIMDIDAFMDLQLGTGLQKIGPLKGAEIYQQTGRIYYSGQKISGEKGQVPIQQLLSSYGNMLKDQIEVYNFELNCIRDYLGINEVKDGSSVPERMGLGVMQGQMATANMSTAHIYGGYISIKTDTAKSIGILLWDALNTPEINSMYIGLLGKENAEFIRYNKELTKSNYLTRISVNMSTQDLAWLDNLTTTAVQQQQMEPEDALMVKKYAQFNFEYAVRYLSFIKAKRAKLAQQQAIQQQTQQEQATAQLAQSQQQAKAEAEQASDTREMIKITTEQNGEHILKIQDLINLALIEQMQTGAELPVYVQQAIAQQLQAHILQQETQIKAMEEGLQLHDLEVMGVQQQAAMQQQAQAAQGQQMPQQQGEQVAA